MSGHVGDLSAAQEEALAALKAGVQEQLAKKIEEGLLEDPTEDEKELIENDLFYLKFLRARKFNVPAALKMYMDTALWRRNFQGRGVASVTENDVVNEVKHGKSFFYKYDRWNRTVLYVRPRYHFPDESTVEEMERSIVWHMETGRKLLRPGVETGLVIYDMAGFSLANMDYRVLKYEIKLLESYYPESLGTTLIVNAPWVFYGCWQIIKPWIDPVARAKILFVDVADIKKWVEPKNLLKEYGGEDPYTFSYVPPDERNDENEYVPPWEMDWRLEPPTEVTPELAKMKDCGVGPAVKKVGDVTFQRPELQPDAEVQKCPKCSTEFGWITRKHHCRSCGKIFCSQCCSAMIKMPEEFGYGGVFTSDVQRCCHGCAKTILDWKRSKEKAMEVEKADS